MSDALIGQIIAGVLALATIIGGFWWQGRQLSSQERMLSRVKEVVDDPKTGMAATHAVANSALSETQEAKRKSDAEVARLNEARTDLAAKTAADLKAEPAPVQPVASAVQAEVAKELSEVKIADPRIVPKE